MYERDVTKIVEEELAKNLLPPVEKLDEPLRRALRNIVARVAGKMEHIQQTAGVFGHN